MIHIQVLTTIPCRAQQNQTVTMLPQPKRDLFSHPQEMTWSGIESPLGPGHASSWLLQKLTLSCSERETY